MIVWLRDNFCKSKVLQNQIGHFQVQNSAAATSFNCQATKRKTSASYEYVLNW